MISKLFLIITNIFTFMMITEACLGGLFGGGGNCCPTQVCPPAAIPCGGSYGGSYYAAPTYGGAGK